MSLSCFIKKISLTSCLLLWLCIGGAFSVQAAQKRITNSQFELDLQLPAESNYTPNRGGVLYQFFLDGGSIRLSYRSMAKGAEVKRAAAPTVYRKYSQWLISQEESLLEEADQIYRSIDWMLTNYQAKHLFNKIPKEVMLCTPSVPLCLSNSPLKEKRPILALKKKFCRRRATPLEVAQATKMINCRAPLDLFNLYYTLNTSVDLILLTLVNTPYLAFMLMFKSIGFVLVSTASMEINYSYEVEKKQNCKLFAKGFIMGLRYSLANHCYSPSMYAYTKLLTTFITPSITLLSQEAMARKKEDRGLIERVSSYKSMQETKAKHWDEDHKQFCLAKSAIEGMLKAYKVEDEILPDPIVAMIIDFTHDEAGDPPQFEAKLIPISTTYCKLSPIIVNITLLSTLYGLCLLYLAFTYSSPIELTSLSFLNKDALLLKGVSLCIIIYLSDESQWGFDSSFSLSIPLLITAFLTLFHTAEDLEIGSVYAIANIMNIFSFTLIGVFFSVRLFLTKYYPWN